MQNQDPTQDNKNYKFWVFYFNPKDERVFVPKKIESLGITLNFAKKESYLFLVGAGLFFGFVSFFILNRR